MTPRAGGEDSLRRMLAGPGLMVLARAGGALAAMAFTVMLTRSMGAAGAGEVAVGMSLAMVLSLLCTLNVEAGAVRFMVQDLAGGQAARAAAFVRFGRRFVLAVSLVAMPLAAGALWLMGHDLGSPELLALVAAPILGSMRFGAGLALGVSRPVLSVLPRTLLRPLFMAALVGLHLVLAGPPTGWSAMALFVMTCALALVAQAVMLAPPLRAIGPAAPVDPATARSWVRVGLTLGLNVLYIEYAVYVAVMAGAAVLSDADTARLDVMLKLTALLSFALAAINAYFSPRMSRAVGANNRAALERLIAISGAMRLGVVAVGALPFLVLGGPILAVFGPEFAGDAGLLRVLLLEAALIAAFGAGSSVVGFSGRPHATLWVLGATLVSLVGGVLALGAAFGLAGAVWAVVASRLVWVAGSAWLARRIAGVDTTVWGLPRYLRARRPMPGE